MKIYYGMTMAIIADTGGILVLFDQSHPKHQATLDSLDERLIVPSLTLPEIDYLSHRLPRGAMRSFMASLLTQEFEYYELDLIDLQRANEIMNQYADAKVGLVDASVVAVAERLNINRILTIDQRHFSLFKPKNLGFLELLP
jgi:uncharacterized protein